MRTTTSKTSSATNPAAGRWIRTSQNSARRLRSNTSTFPSPRTGTAITADVRADATTIIIDAGKSARSLCLALKSIGSDISDIDAIFITHEHADHVSALETLSKKHHIPIHAPRSCADYLARPGSATSSCTVGHPPLFTVELDGITVSSFLTSHDSRCPVGYRIATESGETFGVATDTGIVTCSTAEALAGCRGVVIECNHDKRMLATGPYPPFLKDRIASARGHLSNDDCAKFVAYLAERGTASFILAHLSAENNTKEIALAAVRRAIPDESISVEVSDPDTPTFMK